MSELFGFPSKVDKYTILLVSGLMDKLREKNILTMEEINGIIETAHKHNNNKD